MSNGDIIPDTWETKVQSVRQQLLRIAMHRFESAYLKATYES